MRHLIALTRLVLLGTLVVLLSDRPADAELVGFWSFDDETADDLSPHENHGFLNGVEFSDDVPPGTTGLSLDVFGAGTVQIPHSESLGMADTMSVAFWMKADNLDQGSDWNGTMGKISDPREDGGWETQRWEADSRIDIRIDTDEAANSVRGNLLGTFDSEWVHVAWTVDSGEWISYLDGFENAIGTYPHGSGFANDSDLFLGNRGNCCAYTGLLDEISIWDHVLTPEEVEDLASGIKPTEPGGTLQAGDANQDLSFDQLDIVQISVAAKYLTGQPATWGEGDWNGAPGGSVGSPPPGDGVFDQVDIIAALSNGFYLTGPYGALALNGNEQDEQTSLVYDANTGELRVDAPASTELTSIFVTSAGTLFIGDKPPVLDGPFDSFGADNIFKSTIGSSFGDSSFGNVLSAGLSEATVAADLSASGSLAGGGGLGEVDLVYIPEPSALVLLSLGVLAIAAVGRRRR